MEEIIASVVRDLPSTAVLILFVWFTSKQFNTIVEMVGDHLDQINKILEQCIRSRNVEEQEKLIALKMYEADRLLESASQARQEQRKSQGS